MRPHQSLKHETSDKQYNELKKCSLTYKKYILTLTSVEGWGALQTNIKLGIT